MNWRRVTAGVAIVAAVAGVSSCSFGDKQKMTDAIIASASAASQAGSATGTLGVAVTLVKTRTPPPPGPPRITPIDARGIPVALDLSNGQSAIGLTDAKDASSARLIFSDSWLYERRTSVHVGVFAASNIMPFALPVSTPEAPVSGRALPGVAPGTRPTAGRPWLQLDFARLPRKDQNRAAGSIGINPGFFLTLLKGTLTGSVRRVGTDTTTIDGETTTHYRMNVGRDKAERGLSDKAKTTLDRVFRANAVAGLVYRAEVWIDAHGLPRLVIMHFRQSLGSDTKADLGVYLYLAKYGEPVHISVPGHTQVATVRSFGQLVHAAVGA